MQGRLEKRYRVQWRLRRGAGCCSGLLLLGCGRVGAWVFAPAPRGGGGLHGPSPTIRPRGESMFAPFQGGGSVQDRARGAAACGAAVAPVGCRAGLDGCRTQAVAPAAPGRCPLSISLPLCPLTRRCLPYLCVHACGMTFHTSPPLPQSDTPTPTAHTPLPGPSPMPLSPLPSPPLPPCSGRGGV